MKLYLDSADVREIQRWRPVISGVTTNPTLLPVAERVARLTEICKIVPMESVSVELVGQNENDMLMEAAYLLKDLIRLVIKVPILNPDGRDNLGMIHALAVGYNCTVNATICMSFNQLMLATLAGASYVSLFWGRVADEGGDPARIVTNYVSWNRTGAQLIVGSIRGPADVQAAAIARADIVTVPPAVMNKAVRHQYSQETSRQFFEAGNL